MEKVIVYYACRSGGDGSVYLEWFLSQDKASDWEENQDEGWGEDCTGAVETYIGSAVHNEAVVNEKLEIDQI